MGRPHTYCATVSKWEGCLHYRGPLEEWGVLDPYWAPQLRTSALEEVPITSGCENHEGLWLSETALYGQKCWQTPSFLCWVLPPPSLEAQARAKSEFPSTWLTQFTQSCWFPEIPKHPIWGSAQATSSGFSTQTAYVLGTCLKSLKSSQTSTSSFCLQQALYLLLSSPKPRTSGRWPHS